MEVKEVRQSLGKVVILESDLFYGEPMRLSRPSKNGTNELRKYLRTCLKSF